MDNSVEKNKLDKMKELVSVLNEASNSYYRKNISIMTDFEYDKLYDELQELESKTGVILEDSPSINVEPEISNSLARVQHSAPMLSLQKTKQISELISFIQDREGLLSWKLDGLTIVLTYENGKLVSGVTRGNGIIGEVVTENVKKFKNVPLTIDYKGKLILRGEAIIKYSDFNKMNEDSGDIYKNPRNLCSGSVRQLDSEVTAKRNVNCVIFSLIESSDFISNSKKECFEFLTKLGFQVVESEIVNKNNLKEKVLVFKERVKSYDIPSDGLVLTFDDISYSKSLGATAKFPRHSIAFKWQDETAKTTLRSIDWLVSRTGLINPVAIFDPVELEGTTVSRASLHNVSILQGLEIGIGDEISVYKANMIIPQIAENFTKSNNLEIPKICPVCKAEARIVMDSDVKYLYCTNEFCSAKFLKKLSLFVSRNAMNIEGISEAILNKLISEGMIKRYSDIYKLEQYKGRIILFEGFGEKSYNNLISSIEKSRNVKLENFIYALGIPDIGLSRAKLICSKFNNDYEKICALTFQELSNIDGIGEVIAKEWVDEFNNETFREELNNLTLEVNFIKEEKKDTSLNDLTFVITGSVNNFKNRDELIKYIEDRGGKVLKAISNNVKYLINNDVTSTSTKNMKAKELGIKIISEDELVRGEF